MMTNLVLCAVTAGLPLAVLLAAIYPWKKATR